MQDLHFLEACLAGDGDTVQSLLELGVDINTKTPVCMSIEIIIEHCDHGLTGHEYYTCLLKSMEVSYYTSAFVMTPSQMF